VEAVVPVGAGQTDHRVTAAPSETARSGTAEASSPIGPIGLIGRRATAAASPPTAHEPPGSARVKTTAACRSASTRGASQR
jgi:hypothetical protein